MNRNRNQGHQYERDIMKELRELGYDVVSTRSESRTLDNAGVDIIGNIPCYIQCKNLVTNASYHLLLSSDKLPKDKPTVIMHKKTKKANTRFIAQGEYVIMTKEYFYKLINK